MKTIISIFVFSILLSCNSSEEKKTKPDNIIQSIKNNKSFPKLESNRYNVAFLIMNGTYNT